MRKYAIIALIMTVVAAILAWLYVRDADNG